MNVEAVSQQQRQGLIKSSNIVLLAFATAFFARLIEALGLPAAVNFLHFATIPLACGIALVKARSKSQRQLAIVQEILLGLLIFFILMCASGLLNNAGLINVVLNYLMLTEPYLLLLAIACIPMSLKSVEKLHGWLVRFGFINLLFAFRSRCRCFSFINFWYVLSVYGSKTSALAAIAGILRHCPSRHDFRCQASISSISSCYGASILHQAERYYRVCKILDCSNFSCGDCILAGNKWISTLEYRDAA
jgi:hypothetical protein